MIGTCRNCNQQAELHKDADNRIVCEDCITSGTPLGSKLASQTHTLQVKRDYRPSRRDELLDFIVTRIDKERIGSVVNRLLESYHTHLVEDSGWIKELEEEPNERVLLRLATELGYTPAPPPRPKQVKSARTPLPANQAKPDQPKRGRPPKAKDDAPGKE